VSHATTLRSLEADHGPEGAVFTLRPRGAGRWVAAGFLTIWLCGWALGELFAGAALLALLAQGLGLDADAIPGFKFDGGASGGAIPIGAFLVVWLSFWTLGGVMAMRQWLLSVWSRERISVANGTLRIERHFGPWRTQRSVELHALGPLQIAHRSGALHATVAGKRFEIARLGTWAERVLLRDQLAQLTGARVTDDDHLVREAKARLREGWELSVTPTGETLLRRDPLMRRKIARGVGLLAAACSIGFAWLISGWITRGQAGSWVGGVVLASLTSGLIYAALRLGYGEAGWVLRRGSIAQRLGIGSRIRTIEYPNAALELALTTDSDGDETFRLRIVSGHKQILIDSDADSATALAGLAQLIVEHTGLPLVRKPGEAPHRIE
jgi:hypothetical protein